MTAEDIESLTQDSGVERALFVVVYASRCNDMTRISNGFQLTLERENVFFDYYSDEKQHTPRCSRETKLTMNTRAHNGMLTLLARTSWELFR